MISSLCLSVIFSENRFPLFGSRVSNRPHCGAWRANVYKTVTHPQGTFLPTLIWVNLHFTPWFHPAPGGAGRNETMECTMIERSRHYGVAALIAIAAVTGVVTGASAQNQKPNILVIMGDDVGWFNIGAYHQGMMSGRTPNLDKLASEGMRFTDYYAEASCTAGRANFITGQLPIRTGLTTVGQAGADVGIPDQAVTLATVLKSLGYATGQFGKNHLGDLNKYLPTVHGFDEYFGYLYHLDAMSDPYWFDYPQDWIDKYGPRNLVHCYATDNDNTTEMPRWGKVGKQRIVDEGPLAPFPEMSGREGWQEGRKAK